MDVRILACFFVCLRLFEIVCFASRWIFEFEIVEQSELRRGVNTSERSLPWQREERSGLQCLPLYFNISIFPYYNTAFDKNLDSQNWWGGWFNGFTMLPGLK